MALSNKQFENIAHMIEERRIRALEAQKAALLEVESKIPSYGPMEAAIASDQGDRVFALIKGDKTAADKYLERIEDLREQEKVLLLGAGFPADFLEVHYTCPVCKDKGYINGEKCRCFKQAESELLFDASNIKELLVKENFDTFNLNFFDKTYIDDVTGRNALDNMRENLAIAKAAVESFELKKFNFLFSGNPGTGKTFLSNCIAKEMIKKGYSVIYLPSEGLFTRLANGAFNRGVDERDAIFGCDLLIIDDLGTEMVNSFVVSQLFTCLNERKLRGKSTIISTNLDLNELRDTYTERISSRLLENFRICRFFNPDIRIIKRQNGR